MADVTQEAYDIISSRSGAVFRNGAAQGNNFSIAGRVAEANRAAKPRPTLYIYCA